MHALQHSCLQSSAGPGHWERSEGEDVAAFCPSPPHSQADSPSLRLLFNLLFIQNCAASPLLQAVLQGWSWMLLEAGMWLRDSTGLSPPAQALYHHGQDTWTGLRESLEPSASLAGPLPWQRLYLSLADMSSRAVHQTKPGSHHAADPCLQPPVNTLDQPQPRNSSFCLWVLFQLNRSRNYTGGRKIWQWVKRPESRIHHFVPNKTFLEQPRINLCCSCFG